MKRGKDDEKFTGPMFPRLHVNDADKGGPRAPPRNKMALYEQLSIPSQRFSHSVMQHNINNAVPNSIQGGYSDGGMFFSDQVAHGHQIEKHYSPYSGMSTPLQQVEQRKKVDEEDYTVPIFIQHGTGKEFNKSCNDMDQERGHSSSNLSYLNPPLKFQKVKDFKHSNQEGRNHSAENSKDFAGTKVKAVPVSSHKIDVPGSNHSNSVDGTKTGSNLRAEIVAMPQPSDERQNIAAVAKRNSSILDKVSHLENQNSLYDHIDDAGSREDRVCRSFQNDILERGDSVSETSILDSVSGHDITADDIVAIIGQKHFWKARKAIVNQQRVFAVQVFELHRLIKVQKLIAASPHLLLEDAAACLGKALKSKKLPLPAKPKVDSHRKEVSEENSIEKTCLSSRSSLRPLNIIPTTPSLNGEPNARQWYANQPQGHQWLIPVMSPSEGLLYKPYPALNQDCNGYGPFPVIPYGVPHQYQFPATGYFHPYGMPVTTTTTTFSGSSVDQVNPQANKEVNCGNQMNPPRAPSQRNDDSSMDIDVQGSTASSLSGSGKSSMEKRNVLPLFPAFPDSGERPSRGVIKVVPRNATSVSESVARIIQSIEEERRQFDSA